MIKIEQLSKHFGNEIVLKNITTEIKKGEVISIIGPSGTGKSTFLRCLNLLEEPSGGKIIIDGTDILSEKKRINQIRQKMGMVFQSFNLFHHLTVLENLTIGPIKLLNKSKSEAEKKALDLLKMVGLADKKYSFTDELSGGQKQRVAIARCLSMDPEIILFDEPTSSLDPTMVSEVLAVMRKLADEGLTMLIVTHEMEFAYDVSNRVFYMDEGIIYEEGSPDEIFNNPQKIKTDLFINRISNFNYAIDSQNYDMYHLNGMINEFSKKHLLTPKTANKLILMIEELLQIYIQQYHQIKAVIKIEFSKKNHSLKIILDYSGEQKNILLTENEETEIGLSILKSYSSEQTYSFDNNLNHISLLLKKEKNE